MENEIWQAEVNGQIYETTLEELKEWIAERSLLPEDNVRKNNLRWTQAARIPALRAVFEQENAPQVASTVATKTVTEAKAPVAVTAPVNFKSNGNGSASPEQSIHQSQSQSSADRVCQFHENELAAFICRKCANAFCEACPKPFGNLKICPFCSGMCYPIAAPIEEKLQPAEAVEDKNVSKNFGFEDFRRAWIYPFKFWQSLGFGALFVSLLSLGGFFGGLLANMILFGCISRVINQVAGGNFKRNFVPDLDKFDIRSDVIKPFFLSIGVVIVTWGPFVILFTMLVGYAVTSLSNPSAAMQAQKKNTESAVAESPSTQILLGKKSANQADGSVFVARPEPQPSVNEANSPALIEENNPETQPGAAEIVDAPAQVSSRIKIEQPKSSYEIVFGLFEPIFNASLPLILLLALTVLWGVFYSPMAFAIAGYTKSFTATINPLIGVTMIRRMGATYTLAFVFWSVTWIVSLILFAAVSFLTSPFESPFIGNLPAKFVNGALTFYFSLVVAFLLGSALYKTSDRLGIRSK